MAGEDSTAAGSAAEKRALKEKEEEDEDELDNVPLSVSRGRKASNASASKAKKEEEEEDDDDWDNEPISRSRGKKGNEKPKSTPSRAKASRAKKEENDSDDDFKEPVQKKSGGGAAATAKASKVKKMKDDLVKDEKKTKMRGSVKGEKAVTGKEDKAKKERKVYDLPGQKHDPPEEGDPLRIFYESLYEQIPTSDMAATWMMEWGLLPLDEARKVFEKKQAQKMKSPVKTTSARGIPASPSPVKKAASTKKTGSTANTGKTMSQRKRKASSDSDDDDDDFVSNIAKTKRQKASR